MEVESPGVRIDVAHADLLYGLVRAHKPTSVLEFGFGGGRSAEAILSGLAANGQAYAYTLVDDWRDWTGQVPDEARAFAAAHPDARMVCQSERLFVAGCRDRFDFIMSDADHLSAHLWHSRVYADMLAPGGILCYHDVRAFPGLGEIVSECERDGVRHVVFDQCSVAGEACQRGLLVVFKEP